MMITHVVMYVGVMMVMRVTADNADHQPIVTRIAPSVIVTPDVRGEELSTSASVVKVTQEMDSDAHLLEIEVVTCCTLRACL